MKRYYKQETQREKDAIYQEAVENSTVRALRDRERIAQATAYADSQMGRVKQQAASYAGAKARILWTTKNQNRLIRVFA